MIQVMRCDRCGKIFELPSAKISKDALVLANSIRYWTTYKDVRYSDKSDRIDICPQCAKEFENWLYKM